jgi:photosystem II stability/assembly factor-like uncharacterized protein
MTDQLENDLIFALAAPASFGQVGGPCFAARASGLFRSVDGGRTWQDAYQSLVTGPDALSTSSVAFSPEFERDRVVFAGVPGGVVVSKDGGQNWRAAIFPPPAPLVVSLVISPNFGEDETLFAGTAEDGVFISTDGGKSWTAWNFGLLDLNILCLAISPDFTNDETLYAGTTTGLFVSTNGGRAWREVELPADLVAVLSLAVSPAFTADRTMYVGTEEHGLFRGEAGADQAGMRWEAAGAGLGEPFNAILLAPGFPKSPEVLVLNGSQLWVSSDRSGTFQPWQRPGLPEGFEVMAAAAPLGFGEGAAVLVGGENGKILLV